MAGLTVTVTVGTFDGELSDLMAGANDGLGVDRITSPQTRIITTQGSTGLIESFNAANSHGFLAVFAKDGVGLEFEAIGPEPLATRYADEINAMIVSLNFGGAS